MAQKWGSLLATLSNGSRTQWTNTSNCYLWVAF